MQHKWILKTAAILLCAGSMICTVALWVNEQNSLWAMLLAGTFAGSLELCKFAFFPLAARTWETNRATGAFLYLLAGILLVASIGASVAFLETGTRQQLGEQQTNSAEYLAAEQNIASLQQRIDTANELIAKDADSGYRQRAYERLPELEKLIDQKNAAVSQLKTIDTASQEGAGALFEIVAEATRQQADSVRHIAYFSAAILVDVCGIVALMLLSTGIAEGKPNVTTKNEITPTKIGISELVKQSQNRLPSDLVKIPGCPSSETKYREEQLEIGIDDEIRNNPEIIAAVKALPPGEKIGMREFLADNNIRFELGKKILTHLIRQGCVTRKGRFYFRAEEATA